MALVRGLEDYNALRHAYFDLIDAYHHPAASGRQYLFYLHVDPQQVARGLAKLGKTLLRPERRKTDG